ncbi:MAG: proline--tRNA ligase [Patescibacteria group bacterium]
MLYTKLFGKTVKEPKKDMSATSHKLLYQGGFIRESTAGRYYFLPLGMRVRHKIIELIRTEMNRTGAQELLTPVLHPLELWEETNRTNEAGFELTTVEDRRGAKFALGGTAEEMMVALVRQFQLSYKDLPINIYQFSTKFRDELRARGGLLRVREFTMKDAYSFHSSEEDFLEEYENMAKTYERIFNKLGLTTNKVLADNGYIGGDFCHEFVTDTEVGESDYFVSEDNSYIAHEDVAKFKREDINPNEEVKQMKIIEQPEWVKTMEDNEKHYKLPPARFLKNVVYKHRTKGDIVIAVIRGDLEVNKTKLEHVLNAVGQLEDATEEDLAKMNTKPGYVHSWGHKHTEGTKITYIGDLSLTTVKNFIGGQKEEKTDSINVNYGKDFECETLADIALAKNGYLTEEGSQKLISKRGIEVGNIFQLGYHYSQKMNNATFTSETGKDEKYYMGCYGIGIGRTMAAVVEMHNDEKGIIWPENIAPFKYHVVGLGMEDKETRHKVKGVYTLMHSAGLDVLFDDRVDVSAGEKFADADLIGCPYRIVVSKKTPEGMIEIKKRTENASELVNLEEFVTKAANLFR